MYLVEKLLGLPFTHDGVSFQFSPHGGVALNRMSLPGGDNPQSLTLTLTLCSPGHFTMGRFTCLSEYD